MSEEPSTGSAGSAAAGSAGSAAGSAGSAGSAEPAAGSAGSGAAGSAAGSGSSASAGSGDAGEAHTSKFDFDKLTHDQKMDFMKKKVVPAMKPLFQKFDAKKFANFNCKTCHGKDADKNKFKMPNGMLPKLDFAALKAGKQAPKMAEFMGKTVKPGMAKLLEQPEYSESEPKGFGCLECHTEKKAAEKKKK
jgi:hypothetical protein